MADLLIVDDEPLVALGLSRHFSRAGHAVREAGTGTEALAAFRERRPDVILLDVNLPDMSGFDVVEALRAEEPVVVMISGQGDVPVAVRAVQAGAETFLTKPVDFDQLGLAIDRAIERGRARDLGRHASARRVAAGELALGSSPAMLELARQAELLAAASRTPALIVGEPGTGKVRLAGWIHARSARGSGPLVEASCTAGRADILETELFGRAGPRGLVEVAAGGSLLLDEVGALSVTMQARLAGLLESRAFRRPGSGQEVPVDVRVLATSSDDLVAQVSAGRFREDLHYHLSVMPLRLPSLRERERQDLVELATRLVDELAASLPASPRVMDDAFIERLVKHDWPGNLRELRNVMERAMLISRGRETLSADVLPVEFGGVTADSSTPDSLEVVEREHIARMLRHFGDNRSQAARALGISRATLIKKIRRYGLGPRAPRGRIA